MKEAQETPRHISSVHLFESVRNSLKFTKVREVLVRHIDFLIDVCLETNDSFTYVDFLIDVRLETNDSFTPLRLHSFTPSFLHSGQERDDRGEERRENGEQR